MNSSLRIALLCIVALATLRTAFAGPATQRTQKPGARATATPRPRVAPADEYFGKAGISLLAIMNAIKDLALDEDRGGNPAGIAKRLEVVRNAADDWYRKYPNDPWVPQQYARLCVDIARLPQQYRKPDTCAATFSQRFPNSGYPTRPIADIPTPKPKPSSEFTRLWTKLGGSAVELDFGGQGNCTYHAALRLDSFSVVTDAGGGVTRGSLQVAMNETSKEVCHNAPLGQRTLRFAAVDGQLTGDGGVVHFGADKANEPQTTASFVAVPGQLGFRGTLTLTRTDAATPVNWSAQLPITLVGRILARLQEPP